MADLVGKTLGQYQILEELGRGGMAVVYKAFQPSLNRYVAIKVLPEQYSFDQDFVERFMREARGAAALHHQNIVTIHDVAQQNGTYFIVMEYAQGCTLDEVLGRGQPLPLERVAHIVHQVADALDYAHSQGLVHRDVKPSNIMVDESRRDRVTLMDFGLARAVEGSGLTKTGMIVGTPEYMSPEQAKGEAIDHRTDIYSLGVVLYHMLTGHSPFARTTPHAALIAHMTHEPPSVTEINRALPRSVAVMVTKAVAKDPAQRYQHAGQLARDLDIAITGKTPPGLALPPQRPQPAMAATQQMSAASPTAIPHPVQKKQGNALPWVLVGGGLLAVCVVGAIIIGVLSLNPTGGGGTAQPTPVTQASSTPENTALVDGPGLRKPNDGATYAGSDAKILLEWDAASLTAEEFYVLRLECSGLDEPQTEWVKEPLFQVPASVYDKMTDPRRCQWHITLMEQTGTDAGGARVGEARSKSSQTRSFTWKQEEPTGTPEPSSTPAPTATPTPTEKPTATARPQPTNTPAPTRPQATATPVSCGNGKEWNGTECVCPPGTVWNDKAQWCGSGGGGGGGGGNTPAPP